MGKQPGAEDKSKKPTEELLGDDDHEGGDDEGSEGDAGEGGDKGKSGKKDAKTDVSDEDMSKWTPEQVKDYVKSLRKENAKYRTAANGQKAELADLRGKFTSFESGIKKALGLEEELSPEETNKMLDETLSTQVVRGRITQLAYELGVPFEHAPYFEFLLLKDMDQLGEGEELDEDAIAAAAAKVKALGGKKSTGLPGGGKVGTPDPKSGDEITLDDFEAMTISEKSMLYQKNPELYTNLQAAHRRPKKKTS